MLHFKQFRVITVFLVISMLSFLHTEPQLDLDPDLNCHLIRDSLRNLIFNKNNAIPDPRVTC